MSSLCCFTWRLFPWNKSALHQTSKHSLLKEPCDEICDDITYKSVSQIEDVISEQPELAISIASSNLTAGQDDTGSMMPSTLSKYKKALAKHEKQREKKIVTKDQELDRRKDMNDSLKETDAMLREFLKSSDDVTTTSVTESSSTESLLTGRSATTVDELIRRFETHIPVSVLVSYFNEVQARPKQECKVDMKAIETKLANLKLIDQ